MDNSFLPIKFKEAMKNHWHHFQWFHILSYFEARAPIGSQGASTCGSAS